jgi:hypothetical protein
MKESESKMFSGASLEKALKDDSLTRSGITLVGMVKSSEKGKHISFSRSGCNAWVDLPTDVIEQAEQVGQRRCKDHIHPVFKITLKEAKDPEAKMFISLLAQPYQEQQPEHNTPAGMPPGVQPGAPFYAHASSGPEWGLGPVRGAGVTTNLARRPGLDEYGCCRRGCCGWYYYECEDPYGRPTICAVCRWYCCVEWGCEPSYRFY